MTYLQIMERQNNMDSQKGKLNDSHIDFSGESKEAEKMSQILMSKTSAELETYLGHIQQWSIMSRKKIIQEILNGFIEQQGETDKAGIKELDHLQALLKTGKRDNTMVDADNLNEIKSTITSPDEAYTVLASRKYEENKSGTPGEVIGEVDHMLNKGKFNQKNQMEDKRDDSNEEPNSSFSSSEEALASCEGAVYNVPLDGSPKCVESATFNELDHANVTKKIGPYTVDSTGEYAFKM